MASDNIIQKLIAFYQNSKEGADASMSPAWRTITESYQRSLVLALDSGDEARVEELLANAAPTESLWGIEHHEVAAWSGELAQFLLTRLAQKMGILPMRKPESIDMLELKAQIEAELGFKLEVPLHMGYSGEGVPYRFLHYCASAHTIRSFLRGRVPQSVLEIGAGMANLGIILHRWGCESYTVIDLPVVAVLGALNLSKTCGEDQILMDGEDSKGRMMYAQFFSSTDYHWVFNGRFDIIYNGDSLPEMPLMVQGEYITLIRDTLTKDGIFVSINHESDYGNQRRVYDAVKAHGGFKLIARYPHMMRDGYVEEIYVRK